MPQRSHSVSRRLTAVFMSLCLAFLPIVTVPAESVTSVSVEAAPLTTASSTLDGMVRVYLSSLGTPSTLTLTVAGSYSLSIGASLTSGETLTVGFSSATGAITLTRSGVKTNMGTYFALKRHSASGTNGILISQARKPANPYPGDLSFQSVKLSSGSYKLYTVAHVYIEDYLYGVVPYEMGSSAPAEALKAQTVAARTYTVRMMANRSSGYYDVVDTTSDQVYNGTPSGYAACVAAVDATKGVLLKNSGSYTATYYSASNGGQTESIYNIWGSTGYGYLNVRDDPFDYANPDSIVKKTTVYADCASSGNSASLLALLKAKAVTALNASGYAATSANTTLSTVKSIVAHTPLYASPSRLYTKLDFTLAVITNNSAGASVSATATVTCGIFTELESLLSMSIQSGSNELWTVVKGTSTFTLEARRYGHGLGMSQRGAMYMGKLGYTYAEILGFYFPDSTRVGCTFTNTILAADSTEVVTTEESSATVEESGTDGDCTAVVTLVSASASLAIRAGQSTTSTLLGVAANSSPLTVYAKLGSWCLVGYGGIVGYVPTSALTISGTAPTSSDRSVTETIGFATVKASGYLNLRASGSYSATVLTTAPNGAVMTVFSKTTSWAKVQYGATVAYASVDFLTFSDDYAGTVSNTGTTSATVSAGTAGTVSLRATASTSGSVLAELANGAEVTVSTDDGSWAYVTYAGQSGYVLSTSLTYGEDATSDTGTSDTGSSADTDSEPTATVSASVGYLRVSESETAAMIMEVPMGQSVVLVSRGDVWCAVRYEGVNGYLLTASLTLPDVEETETLTATVLTTGGSLNLRGSASAGSTILTTIPYAASVTVTSRGETWSAVTYGGLSGYVMTAYLLFAGESTTDDTAGSGGGTATVTTESGSLNLRQLPKAGSTILRTIPRLAGVTVLSKGSEWSQVAYSDTIGYVMSVFLTFTADTATETDDTATDGTADSDAADTAQEDGADTSTGTDDTQSADTDGTTDTNSATDTGDTASDTATDETNDSSDTALTAIVTTASGALNLRADMLPGSRIYTRIPRGTVITILEKLAAWSQTTYGGYTGYVMNSYLTFPVDTETSADSTTATAATVLTASGSLNLRDEPYGAVLLRIPQYAAVLVYQRGGDWSYLAYGGIYGYAMTAYLSFDAATTADSDAADTQTVTDAEANDADDTATDASTDSDGTGTISATVNTASGSLNLRAAASTAAQVLTTVPQGETVTVLEQGDTWCQVRYGLYAGYVMTQYLLIAGAADTSAAGDTADASTDTPTDGSAETSSASTEIAAWVYTASGGLNLRESASTTAAVIASMPRLEQVTLLSQGATWCNVRYDTLVGYAMTAYLTTTKPSEVSETAADTSGDDLSADTDTGTTDTGDSTAEATVTEDPTLQAPETALYAYVTPLNAAVTHPLWEACTQEKGRLLDMLANSQVQVLRRGDTWCEVLYFTLKGYCLTEGLTMIGE
ncbi:MAG: SH3 domain-containing protein [Clostridiales bacterium]|nr:SH3 domain-containing protein [Clostridiales bacterium]